MNQKVKEGLCTQLALNKVDQKNQSIFGGDRSFAFSRLHSTILKRWDGLVILFFFLRSTLCLSLDLLNPIILTQSFLGRGMMLTVINLSDHLCEIYLLIHVLYDQFIIFSFQIVITWKRLSQFRVMFEFRIWDSGFHVLRLPNFGKAS